jgi:hypothetical protein
MQRDAIAKELKRRANDLFPQVRDWNMLHFRRRLLDPAFRAVLSLAAQETH